MHKRKLKRNTLTQALKSPESFSRGKDCVDNQDESSDYFQLPSLQKKSGWKDVQDNVSTCDQYSTATDIYCSSDIENIATRKVMEQWKDIENTLYQDGEQVTQTAVLEECIQWRTQIPHLRLIGKNPFYSIKTNSQELNENTNQTKTTFNYENEEAISEYNLSFKEKKNSLKQNAKKTQQDEIFEMLYEYVVSEIFPNKENDNDSLHDDFKNVLQIHTAPIHSNKCSAKSTKFNWFEETVPLENRLSNINGKALEYRSSSMKRETAQTNTQIIQKKYDNSTHMDKTRYKKDESTMDDKLFRPHTSRNKLGTVFNEKIVVSSVPYVLSTRESFSTVQTTPIKFMADNLEGSAIPGPSRNINYIKNLGKNSTSAKISNYQSAWHAPVSPAVWPKNIKLAPLDTSRLHSSKNRFSTSSSVTFPRNRKPLSPISRPGLPAPVQSVHNSKIEGLEIQGIHICSGQSSKINTSTTQWENVGSGKSIKKRNQQKIKP